MEKHFHRRNLPHLYFSEGIYFITARLKDTIPLSKLKMLSQKNELSNENNFEEFKKIFLEYDSFLDFGKNYNLLTDNKSVLLSECLHYPDKREYKLICYVIMPNHFHLVFELLDGNKGISKIMQSIKGISAKRINVLLNRTGSLWQDESYDRWLRNDVELYFIIRYVLNNPVTAGLVSDWRNWKYSFCHPDYLVLCEK